MEKGPKNQESILPVGKSVEELLLSTPEEFQEIADKANKTVDDMRSLLISAVERKNAALEKALEKKKEPKSVDVRAEEMRKEILEMLEKLDFFTLAEQEDKSEDLENQAFSYLNKVEDERDSQKQRYLKDMAWTLFRESLLSWAGKRVNDDIREGKSHKEALLEVADELRVRVHNDNVMERSDAAQDVMQKLWSRSYNEEMYKELEKLRTAYKSGTPSEEDQTLMRKLMLAGRGQFLTQSLSNSSMNLYGVEKFSPIIRDLGRAYKRVAGFNLDQNNGALGSIEKFDLDMPNSYNNQGSPRSRPRRSSIPEERY